MEELSSSPMDASAEKGRMSMQATILEEIDPRVLGARLQDARRGAGLTQQAVADRMEMARTTIVAIEKGERRITPAELIRFAKLYLRQVSDLVGRRAPAEGFVAQFRSNERQALEENQEYEQVALELQRRSEDYAELERIAGVSGLRNYPPVYETTGGTIDQVASDIAAAERNRLGLGDGPIGNLRERLEAEVGLRIFYFAMPSKIAGAFAYNEDLGACVGINSNHPRDRRQWSLAHECGHFLMHRYQAEITILLERRMQTAKERVADAFAENFLMPLAGLNRRFTDLHRSSPKGVTLGDIVSLANLYQVSVQALVLRLETLRRIAPGTWERLVTEGFEVQKAQHLLGIDANPPIKDLFPQRYVALAVSAFRNGDLSEGQLAKYLRSDRLSSRLIVEELQNRIHREFEGDFTGLELDLAQPLGSR
jgi:Zn-dependent peptidase ImmA (M78 family)/transcriptional regulator with XRE-family HTH domain